MNTSSAPASITRRLLRLALPLAGTQLSGVALAATDTAVLGRLGVVDIAGGALAVLWFNQLRTMGVGLLTPLSNRIAETAARTDIDRHERDERVRGLSRLGIQISTVAGVLGALLLVVIGWALPWLGQPRDISTVALHVILALAPSLVPCLWFQAIRQFTVGLGQARALLGITLGSVLVNLVLDLVLAFGAGPVTALGAAGVGLATTLVHVATAVVFVRLVRRDPRLRDQLDLRPLAVRAELVRTQLRLGVPVAATYGAEAGMFSVLAMIMGSFGAPVLAAHNVVYQVTFIVLQIGIGFSHGGSTLISSYRAEDSVGCVRGVAARMLGIMGAVVGIAGLLFLLWPGVFITPFLSGASESVLRLSFQLLAVGAVMEFADIAQNLGIGALRGMGDTRTGLRASLIGYWAIGLPMALLLAYPGRMGPVGIWWGLTIGLATAAVILWRRFWALTSDPMLVPDSVSG